MRPLRCLSDTHVDERSCTFDRHSNLLQCAIYHKVKRNPFAFTTYSASSRAVVEPVIRRRFTLFKHTRGDYEGITVAASDVTSILENKHFLVRAGRVPCKEGASIGETVRA